MPSEPRRWARRPPGLRGRLIAALLLTSAVTLAAVAVTMLSPLQDRLRQDRLHTLATATFAARTSVERLGPNVLKRSSERLIHFVRVLHRRTSADVAVLDGTGRLLAGTDPDHTRLPAIVSDLGAKASLRRVVTVNGETQAEVAVRARSGGRDYLLFAEKSLDDVDAAVRTVVNAFEIAAIIGFGTALLLGVALATRLSRRLKALRTAALSMADTGPEVEMHPDQAHDEVGDLSRAFATMQTRLTEQEQARRRFVATASHELRTPLSSLQLMLDLLEQDVVEGRVDAAEIGEQLARSKKQAERVTKLAAELLDLSRIDARVPLRQELVELSDLCRAVVGEFAGAGVGVELSGPSRCWSIADPGSIARVVRILVENALRFSPPGEPVCVEVTCADDGADPSISVSDAGPGVAENERELIFERFRRGHEPAGDGGFGLGLAIGRELARRMDGDLRLDEPGERGARFTLVLPGAPADTERDRGATVAG